MNEPKLNGIDLDLADRWAEGLARKLADAFRPYLARVDEIDMEEEIRKFLRVDETPPTEELEFSPLECDSALRAITRWCGLAKDHNEKNFKVSVRGLVSRFGRTQPPSYRFVSTGIDQNERVLSSGLVFAERESGQRFAVKVAYESPIYGDAPSCNIEFFFPPDSTASNEEVLADFRRALNEAEIGRAHIMVFDRTGSTFLKSPNVSWDDVVLPTEITDEVRRNVVRPLAAYGANPNSELGRGRALLLSGPPGTGKTMIGKALATTLKEVTFLWVTPGGFDRSADPGHFFRWARKRAPAVIFFEDLDLVTGIRGGDGYNSILGEILAQMDGFIDNRGLVIIATTNEAEVLDDALRRPGRFDRHLTIGAPAEGERRRLLERLLAGENVAARERTLDRLAAATSQLTGAHLRELIHTVRINRADESNGENNDEPIEYPDFEVALANLRTVRRDIGFANDRR